MTEMSPTSRAINRRAIRRVAREFVFTLATRGLLEHVRRFESTILAGEDTAFARTFASTDWARAFGDVVEHDVLCSIEDTSKESLDLTALDWAGRPLLKQTFYAIPNERLRPVSERF